MDRFILNLCPTGMIPTKKKVPALPTTPSEIAADAKRCRDAGASIVHLHARDSAENPVWHKEVFSEIVERVLDAAPDIIVCVTTTGRSWADVERRTDALRLLGRLKPEMASLTLGSMNFPKAASINAPDTISALAKAMLDLSIVPELEVFDAAMADYSHVLIERGLLRAPLYFNILLGSVGAAAFNARNIACILDALPHGSTWALAGIGRHQLHANVLSLTLGGNVRVGLEDNPYIDWSSKTGASNPQLVERLVKIAREMGREPATPEEARSIIGIGNPGRGQNGDGI